MPSSRRSREQDEQSVCKTRRGRAFIRSKAWKYSEDGLGGGKRLAYGVNG